MIKATPEQYREASERILRWDITKGEKPATVTIDGVKYTEAEYKDAITRVQKYIDSNNQSFPPSIRFGAEPIKTPETTDLYTICKSSTIQKGSTGQCVTYAQQKLQEWGFYPYNVDGSFGDMTKQAVITFQKATGHSQDGVLGPKTWSSFPGYSVPKPGALQGDMWVLSTLQSKGDVGTEQGLRNLLASIGHYLYYYNQQQSQATTVNSLKGNCADLVNDLGLPYYRAKGIACRGVHCQVMCLDGKWYGHYIIELGAQGSKQYRDPAAWAKGKGLTELICNGGFKFLHYEGNSIP
jgi:hypothetical protein